MQCTGDTIPTADPTFAIMSDRFTTLATLPNVGWLPDFNIIATKPEVEITLERQVIATRFQLLSPFATMTDLNVTPPSVDVVRRQPISEI